MTTKHEIEIDGELYDRLEAYADEHGTTPSAIVESLAGGADVTADPVRSRDEVEQAEVDAHFDLLVAQEQLGRAHACIRDLLRAFEREIAAGYTSPEQQAVAVRARRILESP